MLRLDLNASEERILREVLESVISELGMEIAGTDSQDFRERLKERRHVLQKVVEGLTPTSGL